MVDPRKPPADLRPIRSPNEALDAAQVFIRALAMEQALDLHSANSFTAARRDYMEIASLALAALNEAAPALGFGPKVVSLDDERSRRAL